MNMETKYNASDMVGFENYVQSLRDRGMKPKDEKANSSDLENYRVLKSVKLIEGKSNSIVRSLYSFFDNWVKDGELIKFNHEARESKDYGLSIKYDNSMRRFECTIYDTETNMVYGFSVNEDGFLTNEKNMYTSEFKPKT